MPPYTQIPDKGIIDALNCSSCFDCFQLLITEGLEMGCSFLIQSKHTEVQTLIKLTELLRGKTKAPQGNIVPVQQLPLLPMTRVFHIWLSTVLI